MAAPRTTDYQVIHLRQTRLLARRFDLSRAPLKNSVTRWNYLLVGAYQKPDSPVYANPAQAGGFPYPVVNTTRLAPAHQLIWPLPSGSAMTAQLTSGRWTWVRLPSRAVEAGLPPPVRGPAHPRHASL
jgi:hypothetical protein